MDVRPRNQLIVFLLMFSTGFASLLYEVVLISLVATVVGVTEVSSSLVISSFLLGLAVGALIGGGVVKWGIPPVPCLIAIEFLVAAFGFGFLSMVEWMHIIELKGNGLFFAIISLLLIPTILMGMEIPLAVRVLERQSAHATGFVYFSDTLGGVLGAFSAGLFFIPRLGFHGAMFLGGLLNVVTGILSFGIDRVKRGFIWATALLFLLAGNWLLFTAGPKLTALKMELLKKVYGESQKPAGEPIYSAISPFQHIVILKNKHFGNVLVLDKQEQIAEKDSLLYHEYLVLPAIAAHPNPQSVLVIGAGDGGVLYQLLKFPFQRIDHIELDLMVVDAARKYLYPVHRGALDDYRVNRVFTDGRKYLQEHIQSKNPGYDLIIVDLPDPEKIELARLYSKEFYELVRSALNPGGVMATQASTPYYFLEGYTAIYKSIQSVMPDALPYVVTMPSMGSTGYVIASKGGEDLRKVNNVQTYQITGKWYDPADHAAVFRLPKFLREFLDSNIIDVNVDERPVVHLYMQPGYYFKGAADE